MAVDLDPAPSLPIIGNKCATITVTLRGRHRVSVALDRRQEDLCGNIDELYVKSYFFPEGVQTLHLSIQNGETRLTAGSLQIEY